jgi:hypothetical protein
MDTLVNILAVVAIVAVVGFCAWLYGGDATD